MVLAVVGCFLVKGVNVKASDDLIFSVNRIGSSNKTNIIYTEYCEVIDKVVCVTSNNSYCFLDIDNLSYSEEFPVDNLSLKDDKCFYAVSGKYLFAITDTTSPTVKIVKVDLDNGDFVSKTFSIDSYNLISICKYINNSIVLYIHYGSRYWGNYYIINENFEISSKSTDVSLNSSGHYICYAYEDNFIIKCGGYFITYCLSTKQYYSYNSYYLYGHHFLHLDNDAIIAYGDYNGCIYYIKDNIMSNTNKQTSYNQPSNSVSFNVNYDIYFLPKKGSGSIEKLTINDFQLGGENLVFTDVNSPLSYQDILSKYTPSDKYGRSLMTSIKADSYYNSFSTPGNYDATITVSDGYCHEDFDITIVVNKGGGEEEKKENSGSSSIKWDTNLMIQSFGGIAVFLVIGLLVVTIIKKILR